MFEKFLPPCSFHTHFKNRKVRYQDPDSITPNNMECPLINSSKRKALTLWGVKLQKCKSPRPSYENNHSCQCENPYIHLCSGCMAKVPKEMSRVCLRNSNSITTLPSNIKYVIYIVIKFKFQFSNLVPIYFNKIKTMKRIFKHL